MVSDSGAARKPHKKSKEDEQRGTRAIYVSTEYWRRIKVIAALDDKSLQEVVEAALLAVYKDRMKG